MAAPVTTSLVINFTTLDGSEGGILTAEVDDRPDGLNAGNTTFYPGDSPGFLVFKSNNVAITQLLASEGLLQSMGQFSITAEEDLTFANTREASLRYPAKGPVTVVRKSPSGPSLTLVGEDKVTTPSNVVAAYQIRYPTIGIGYRVTGTTGTISVVVFIEGVAS